jgi:hypothetical protein
MTKKEILFLADFLREENIEKYCFCFFEYEQEDEEIIRTIYFYNNYYIREDFHFNSTKTKFYSMFRNLNLTEEENEHVDDEKLKKLKLKAKIKDF